MEVIRFYEHNQFLRGKLRNFTLDILHSSPEAEG